MALHPKVTAGVVAGALTSLIVSEVNRRGITLAPDEASAITVLLTALAGWFMPGDDGNGSGVGQPIPGLQVAPRAPDPSTFRPPQAQMYPPAQGPAPAGLTPPPQVVQPPAGG